MRNPKFDHITWHEWHRRGDIRCSPTKMSVQPKPNKTSTKFNMLLMFNYTCCYLSECERYSILRVEANLVLEVRPLFTRTLLHFSTSFQILWINEPARTCTRRNFPQSHVANPQSLLVLGACHLSVASAPGSTATPFQTRQMPSNHNKKSTIAIRHAIGSQTNNNPR